MKRLQMPGVSAPLPLPHPTPPPCKLRFVLCSGVLFRVSERKQAETHTCKSNLNKKKKLCVCVCALVCVRRASE